MAIIWVDIFVISKALVYYIILKIIGVQKVDVSGEIMGVHTTPKVSNPPPRPPFLTGVYKPLDEPYSQPTVIL